MAIQVEEARLKTLLQLGDGSDAQLGIAIETALVIMRDDFKDSKLSEDRLNAIALYLAAHFADTQTNQGGLVSKKIGETTETYRSFTHTAAAGNHAYHLTHFGKHALLLDTSGTLINNSSPVLPALFDVIT